MIIFFLKATKKPFIFLMGFSKIFFTYLTICCFFTVYFNFFKEMLKVIKFYLSHLDSLKINVVNLQLTNIEV